MLKVLKGEYHGVAHVLATANVTVNNPIGSDVIIYAGIYKYMARNDDIHYDIHYG